MQSPILKDQKLAHLEGTVERAENFEECYPLNVGTEQASSPPLGSVVELPFLPRVVEDLSFVIAVVQLVVKAFQLTEDDFPQGHSKVKDKPGK